MQIMVLPPLDLIHFIQCLFIRYGRYYQGWLAKVIQEYGTACPSLGEWSNSTLAVDANAL